MPKIRNWSVDVQHDNGKRCFDVEIFYNTNTGFYIKIPDDLLEVVNLLDQEEKDKFLIVNLKIAGSRHWTVRYEVEAPLTGYFTRAMTYLMNAGVSKRPVILVFYTVTNKSKTYVDSSCNPEHQKTGIALGIKYCTEISVGDKKEYATFKEGEYMGKPEIVRTPVNISGNDTYVVLHDTPENRFFLEDFHSRLGLLTEKLLSIVESEDTLLQAIAFNQKLLG